jgi:peroxiredoxin
MKEVYARYRSAKTDDEKKAFLGMADSLRKIGKEFSPAMLEVDAKSKLIQQDMIDWRYAYIKKNRNLFSYSLIVYDLLNTFKDVDIQTIKEAYPVYASKYPKHPYTTLCAAVLEGNESVRVGGKLIDFTLPDLEGNKQTLSELIKDKVALIDLWATWCGPCILESRTMAPVYNDFRDKGFTIVGVAAEFKDTKAMKQRIEKEKWPWINLVDLDQQNHIWDIYGISGSGGRIFLVDQKGVILAINPTADEVRKRLTEIL